MITNEILMNNVEGVTATDGGLLQLVKNQKNLKISAELIFDILSLPDFNRRPDKKIEFLTELITEGSYNETIQRELAKLITEGLILSYPNIEKKLTEIANAVHRLNSDIDAKLISGFVYILEEVYAKGLDVRKEIVMLLKGIDTDSSSRIFDSDVIAIKMALVAYGANEYNFGEKLKELDHYADVVKRNKLNELKGAVHYYYAIFKERFPNCWSTIYNDNVRHTSYGHLAKSKRLMFRLAEIKYNYS